MSNPLIEAIMDAFRASPEYQSLASRIAAVDAEVTGVRGNRCTVKYFDRTSGKEAYLGNVPITMPAGTHASVKPGDHVLVVFPTGDISLAVVVNRIWQDKEKVTIPGSSTLHFTTA